MPETFIADVFIETNLRSKNTGLLSNRYSSRQETGVKHIKNGFVTATKLGTTKTFFVATTKNFAAATKRFVDRTKHVDAVTKYFC